MDSRPYYLTGDTVKISGFFERYDGTKILPENPQIKIYNENWVQLEVFNLTASDLLDAYTYQKEYTVSQVGTFYVEIYGIVEGTPSLERTTLVVKQI